MRARLILCTLLLAGCRSPADLILHRGVVWTADPSRPRAEAVAVRGNTIVAVGSDHEVLALRGPSTKVIDLAGAFVVPGFSDNHTHFASAARFLEFNIMTASSQDEFVERLRGLTARLPKGEWILGGYWGAYDQWARGSAGGSARATFTPDMRLVEELSRDHPIFIRKFDDSEFAVNRAALRAAGVDPDNPSAPDVQFLGNGILRGAGVTQLFEKVVPRTFSRQRRLDQTRNALAEIRRRGVTSISDMSDDEQLDIFRQLRDQGELSVRVHFRYPLERWKELADRGIRAGPGDSWIRLGALKGHIDGIMGNSSARFFEPYDHDPQNRGRWRPLMVNGTLLTHLIDADRAGLQVSIHAIGDEANAVLLDYLDQLDRANGPRDRRFRVVHAQVVRAPDFQRFKGVVAEVQPFHLSDDMRWMEERIGTERSRGAYAFRSLRDNGAILSFGSDWPGTSAAEYPINPMLGIYAAVTRQTTAGTPANGWFPAERIAIEEALRAYTWGSSYANFDEGATGSIAVGKLADITVLSKNLLDIAANEILSTEVLYTIVDGKIAHETVTPPSRRP